MAISGCSSSNRSAMFVTPERNSFSSIVRISNLKQTILCNLLSSNEQMIDDIIADAIKFKKELEDVVSTYRQFPGSTVG